MSVMRWRSHHVATSSAFNNMGKEVGFLRQVATNRAKISPRVGSWHVLTQAHTALHTRGAQPPLSNGNAAASTSRCPSWKFKLHTHHTNIDGCAHTFSIAASLISSADIAVAVPGRCSVRISDTRACDMVEHTHAANEGLQSTGSAKVLQPF
jgi:hypothetical protein